MKPFPGPPVNVGSKPVLLLERQGLEGLFVSLVVFAAFVVGEVPMFVAVQQAVKIIG